MTKGMQPIGNRRWILEFQHNTETTDSKYNQVRESWTTYRKEWGNKYEGGGREFDKARELNPLIETQFQTAYFDGLSMSDRILCDGKYYYIHRIQEIGHFEGWNIWTGARGT